MDDVFGRAVPNPNETDGSDVLTLSSLENEKYAPQGHELQW
jgi:hypothetical protein